MRRSTVPFHTLTTAPAPVHGRPRNTESCKGVRGRDPRQRRTATAGVLHRAATDVLTRRILAVTLQADLGEVGGGFVILILRPALERVIVAFVAVEAGGEEQVRGVLHDHVRLTQNLKIRSRRVILVRARGGQDGV